MKFVQVSPIYGTCYTFLTQYPSFIGPQNGLKLTLYTNTEEYLVPSFKAGLRVSSRTWKVHFSFTCLDFQLAIHEKSQMPFPSDQGVNVSPGISMAIGLKKTTIYRKQLPYDDTDCGSKETGHTAMNVFQQLVYIVKYITFLYTAPVR